MYRPEISFLSFRKLNFYSNKCTISETFFKVYEMGNTMYCHILPFRKQITGRKTDIFLPTIVTTNTSSFYDESVNVIEILKSLIAIKH